MAKEKDTVLEIPAKSQDINNFELMKYALEQRKAEFQAIQGKISQYKTQVAALEQRLITLESEHNAKLLQEKQKFDNQKQTKLTELINREAILQRNEEEYIRRKIALENRELNNELVNEEKKNLLNEKLRYEHLNNEAQVKLDEANKKHEESVRRIDEASRKEAIADNKLKEVNNKISIIEKSTEDLKIKEDDIKKQSDNLVALRKDVAPQIEELKSLIAKNEKILVENKVKEQELKDRIEEDNKLMESITSREKSAKKKELDLATKEQELLRKELVIKNL